MQGKTGQNHDYIKALKNKKPSMNGGLFELKELWLPVSKIFMCTIMSD
jgi:hypothetical protein